MTVMAIEQDEHEVVAIEPLQALARSPQPRQAAKSPSDASADSAGLGAAIYIPFSGSPSQDVVPVPVPMDQTDGGAMPYLGTLGALIVGIVCWKWIAR